MELKDFITKIASQFEDTDQSEITADCQFKDLEEWSSLTALSIIAFIKTEYGKSVNGREIRNCDTIEDIFNLVNSK